MASISETGHAKNVAVFENIISITVGLGLSYNPSKVALKAPSLNIQLTAANNALQAVKTAKTFYDNATNIREIAFDPLRTLASKVVSALAATDAAPQTVDDAKTILRKMRGRRSKTIDKPDPNATASDLAPPKTVSTSQQSFDKMIDHFAQLFTIVNSEPKYTPNEPELKISGLQTALLDLRTKNTAVINATTSLYNARVARNKTLYGASTGMVDTARAVKLYMKSVFSSSSPQFRQLSGLVFSIPSRD